MDSDKLRNLYCWVDTIPLSRPKKNIAKDFCDGMMVGEIIAHYCPWLAPLQGLATAGTVERRQRNWDILNGTVLRKLGIQRSKADCDAICNCERGAIESLLFVLQPVLEQAQKPLPLPPEKGVSRETSSEEAVDQRIAQLTTALAEKDAVNAQLQNVISLLNLKVDSLERHLRLKQATIRLLEERAGILEIESAPEPSADTLSRLSPDHVGLSLSQETKSPLNVGIMTNRETETRTLKDEAVDANVLFMQGRMAGFV